MSNAYISDLIADLDSRITFPLLMDLSRDGQRAYGSPAPSFPRNIAIGRDGTVFHEDSDNTLEATQAAIVAALGE